jgi:sRNA-binding regulator protein Hfq
MLGADAAVGGGHMEQQHTGPAVTVIPTPAAAASGVSNPPVARVQNGWLKRMRGHTITLRLQSGEQLSGVLDGDDSYTLALRVPGHTETALVFKHAIAVLVPGGA